MIARAQRFLAIPVLAMGLSGCFAKKAPKTPPPPMVPPARAHVPEAPDPKFPPPPVLADSRAPVEEIFQPGVVPKFPGPPRRPPTKRRPGVAQTQPEPAVAQTPEAPPPPRLGELLTAEQTQQLRQIYNQSFARASRILSSLRGRTLAPEQAEAASRVAALLKQAVDALQRDLGTAAQLAQRADVLARDLRIP